MPDAGASQAPGHARLSACLTARAEQIRAMRRRDKIADHACAMSAVPTVLQEIWLAAEDLEREAERQGLTLTALSDLLDDDALEGGRLEEPASAAGAPWDNFDWLHLALERLVRSSSP
ncbi:hypothetical protein [Halomonas borealis]|uniref:hypothetical protein n=1 Tax=Halomonas borealis TaxID=2508710 RepID=UPI00109FD08D|nr:hypothetical protein [Halomonas borealis]